MPKLFERLSSFTHYGPKRSIQTMLSVMEDQLFDWRYGTDTMNRVNQSELKVISPEHQLQAKPYFPTRARPLRHAFRVSRLPLNLGLVDVGCGKGYAVMSGALYGFKRVTGIEFAPELAEIARANVHKIRHRINHDSQVEIVCADATAHPYGPEDCVFFLYNPFGATIMRGFAEQVARSLEQYPRDIWIIYAAPDFIHVIHECLPVRKVAHPVYGGFDFAILTNQAHC